MKCILFGLQAATKILNEELDAGRFFLFQEIEQPSDDEDEMTAQGTSSDPESSVPSISPFQLVANQFLALNADVFLIDHMWWDND